MSEMLLEKYAWRHRESMFQRLGGFKGSRAPEQVEYCGQRARRDVARVHGKVNDGVRQWPMTEGHGSSWADRHVDDKRDHDMRPEGQDTQRWRPRTYGLGHSILHDRILDPVVVVGTVPCKIMPMNQEQEDSAAKSEAPGGR
jgi:hypothetical protein